MRPGISSRCGYGASHTLRRNTRRKPRLGAQLQEIRVRWTRLYPGTAIAGASPHCASGAALDCESRDRPCSAVQMRRNRNTHHTTRTWCCDLQESRCRPMRGDWSHWTSDPGVDACTLLPPSLTGGLLALYRASCRLPGGCSPWRRTPTAAATAAVGVGSTPTATAVHVTELVATELASERPVPCTLQAR